MYGIRQSCADVDASRSGVTSREPQTPFGSGGRSRSRPRDRHAGSLPSVLRLSSGAGGPSVVEDGVPIRRSLVVLVRHDRPVERRVVQAEGVVVFQVALL
jgi:hypothetical protein